jgi:ribonuclease HI
VYCETRRFEGRYKIEKDLPISTAELKAIERAVILTNSRTTCQILIKALEGGRHNKIAMRILKGIQNAQKQMTIKWIPAHVGLEENKRADILAKDGARNGTPIDYSLQLKEAYRILDETQRDE